MAKPVRKLAARQVPSPSVDTRVIYRVDNLARLRAMPDGCIDLIDIRLHPQGQRVALRALYRQVGFARSLLAYDLPDGPLKLLDGHLRRDLAPDMVVDVEVLDVNDDEARALLLTIDPLAALAQTQAPLHERLLELTPAVCPELAAAWRAAAEARLAPVPARAAPAPRMSPEQYLVLVTCHDEKHQVELLRRFNHEGLECRALLA